MNTSDFTTGRIAGPLVRFALPVLLALCLQSLYGAVDLLVVGRFGIAADVSAVATGSQILLLVTTLFTGLSMGTTILLGQLIGSRHLSDAGEAVGSVVCFFFLMAAVITVLLTAAAVPAARLMQTPEEAFEQTISYVRICTGGIVFIVAYNVLGSIFRGIGDSRTPLITVLIACIFNIAGDVLFVGGFRMWAAGAALATVMAQAISVVISLILIRRKGLPFPFQASFLRMKLLWIRKMLRTGIPIALQDCLVGFSFLVITSIVNGLGVIFSAGVGVAEKVCAFIMLVPMAFSQSLSAFVAQNIGAGKKDRARKSMEYAMMMSIAAGVLLAYAAFFYGDKMSGIFTQDPEVIAASADYLKAYALDTLMVSFLFCYIGFFNGCGRTVFVMAQGLCGAFLVRIPVSFFMSRLPGTDLFRIGLATPGSTLVQIVLCTLWFLKMKRE